MAYLLMAEILLGFMILFPMSDMGYRFVQKVGMTWFIVMVIGAGGVIVLLAQIVSHFYVARIFQWGPRKQRLGSRRRMNRQFARKTDSEIKLDAMDDAALADYVEKHPRSAGALEIYMERLKAERNWIAYASQCQYFLMLSSEMGIEEKCALYNELATLYMGPLAQPARAREALLALTKEFPLSHYATLARERLNQIDESLRAARSEQS